MAHGELTLDAWHIETVGVDAALAFAFESGCSADQLTRYLEALTNSAHVEDAILSTLHDTPEYFIPMDSKLWARTDMSDDAKWHTAMIMNSIDAPVDKLGEYTRRLADYLEFRKIQGGMEPDERIQPLLAQAAIWEVFSPALEDLPDGTGA